MIFMSVLLPAPLRPEQADLCAGIEREIDVLEQFALPKLFVQLGDLDR
jgi:hypothetical protein